MFMCIQNLVFIGLLVFKILSKNSILTLIKGRNSIANLPKFELIQAFVHVLVTCKNEEDLIENEGARFFTTFLPLYVYGDFSRRSRAANSVVNGPIWSNFELVQDFMVVLLTCKNEEERIKKRGARVFTTLYINFSDVQGQITLVLVVVSHRNLNSSKLSCMISLPARMRLIKSKMKELECSQDFSHYKSMGIFPDAQGQLTPQSLVRSGRISNWSEMLWMSSLPANMKKIRSKIEALECSQHYSSIFRRGRADNSVVVGGIWSKFELIQVFMHVLVTCKNEDD